MMTDKTKLAISSAIDTLGRGASRKTSGKITAVNLALEAGISKATLYRYLDSDADLLADFEAIKSRGVQSDDDAPITLDDALTNAKIEIAALRKVISDIKAASNTTDKLKSHQVLVLWTENQRLNAHIKRLESKENQSNLVSINGCM